MSIRTRMNIIDSKCNHWPKADRVFGRHGVWIYSVRIRSLHSDDMQYNASSGHLREVLHRGVVYCAHAAGIETNAAESCYYYIQYYFFLHRVLSTNHQSSLIEHPASIDHNSDVNAAADQNTKRHQMGTLRTLHFQSSGFRSSGCRCWESKGSGLVSMDFIHTLYPYSLQISLQLVYPINIQWAMVSANNFKISVVNT